MFHLVWFSTNSDRFIFKKRIVPIVRRSHISAPLKIMDKTANVPFLIPDGLLPSCSPSSSSSAPPPSSSSSPNVVVVRSVSYDLAAQLFVASSQQKDDSQELQDTLFFKYILETSGAAGRDGPSPPLDTGGSSCSSRCSGIGSPPVPSGGPPDFIKVRFLRTHDHVVHEDAVVQKALAAGIFATGNSRGSRPLALAEQLCTHDHDSGAGDESPTDGHGGKLFRYVYAGASNSLLKKDVYLFAREEVFQKNAADLLTFETTQETAKRLKYIGLLFTSCALVATIPESDHMIKVKNSGQERRIRMEEDVLRPPYCFTDGVGVISSRLAKGIVEQGRESLRLTAEHGADEPLPSVLQIRYLGPLGLFKGVCVVDFSERKKRRLVLRPSMRKAGVRRAAAKVLGGFLGIVAVSGTRGALGGLCRQSVALLAGAGVPLQVLQDVQNDYLQNKLLARTRPGSAVVAGLLGGSWSGRGGGRGGGLNPQHYETYREMVQVLEGWAKLSSVPSSEVDPRGKAASLRIPILQSRRLFGAAFPEKLDWLAAEEVRV